MGNLIEEGTAFPGQGAGTACLLTEPASSVSLEAVLSALSGKSCSSIAAAPRPPLPLL